MQNSDNDLKRKIKEEEIRPQEIFDEYIRLSKKDCKNFFPQRLTTEANCPAGCESNNRHFCKKEQFYYKKCTTCGSIYANLNADEKCFQEFYTEGESTKYWADVFYKKTESKREELLWKPKLERIIETFKLREKRSKTILVDIGGGFGTFAKLASSQFFGKEFTLVVEPNPKLAAECRRKEISVINKFTNEMDKQDLPQGQKLFTSFELLEHLTSPKAFLESINNLMNKGDMLYLTTLSGEGIDINELKENSKAITPPHHINFLSPNGAEKILREIGFRNIETITPGKLDVNIMEKQADKICNETLRKIITRSDKESKEALQRLIVSSKVSSHMHIFCEK
ncbi:class I SAM-dependent methyltransferase [Synechococcus sp. RS9916]|uniref:class I SAM-dependent methyltransferase n=1 Tax=Synechococcus sp. RS9916 TaxID=221359 RepID=UPI0018DCB2F6|nr:class I SAM-dependent methyltransferase [Synechococcus sp. RS9916]